MSSANMKIFFFPLMAPGHTLPMVDMAKLFAIHGVDVALLAIPSGIPHLSRMIGNKSSVSGHPINLISLPLPPGGLNLPGGHENLSSLPNVSFCTEFFRGLESLRQPLDQILRSHRPDCIVSDMFLPWTAEVAALLGISRLVFHGIGFFPLCVLQSVDQYESADDLPQSSNGDDGAVLIPGLPHRIEMKKSQLPDSNRARNKFSEFMDSVSESEKQSFGAVVNSFYELEPAYADHFQIVMKKKAWHIGPVSLINHEMNEQADRGAPVSGMSAGNGRALLAWLDGNLPESVLFVCFGSLSRLAAAQLHEISLALKESGHPFVWIVGDCKSEQRKELVVEEEGKGIVLRGWVPQMLILNHRSVGGFLMHCGWNSLMESVSAGVPVVTWPLFAEQFYTEKLVVEVLGVGVAVGAEEWGMREEEKDVIAAEKIRRAVDRVMDGGEEAEGLRRRVREFGEMGKKAVAVGGSSDKDLCHLIHELQMFKH